jgi:hypothetical protein
MTFSPPLLAQAAAPVASAWIMIPVACVAMLVVAAHVIALGKAEMPASRRRIRSASGALMLLTIPVLAYASSIVTPAQTRLFVLSWTLGVGLLTLVVALALLDMLNTLRLHRAEKAALRQSLRETLTRPADPAS